MPIFNINYEQLTSSFAVPKDISFLVKRSQRSEIEINMETVLITSYFSDNVVFTVLKLKNHKNFNTVCHVKDLEIDSSELIFSEITYQYKILKVDDEHSIRQVQQQLVYK